MNGPVYIIHSAMVEAIKAEFGGTLPASFVVMDKIPSFSTKEKAMTDQVIEQEIQAKGLTAPRITPDDIEANIADVEIVKHVSKTGQVLRWAVITTRNGYAVVGKPSCAVSSANDNAEIGEKIAITNSREELWPLMGYALKAKLAEGGAA